MADYVPVTECATRIRGALKRAFPGVRFSVRSKSYAGGASVIINWTDGPREPEVSKVATRYQGSDFDGMQDLKIVRRSVESAPDGSCREVLYGADFVDADRHYSDAFKAAADRWLVDRLGSAMRETFQEWDWSCMVRRVCYAMDATGAVVADGFAPETWPEVVARFTPKGGAR